MNPKKMPKRERHVIQDLDYSRTPLRCSCGAEMESGQFPAHRAENGLRARKADSQ